jgi:hypothetical protein
MTGCAIVEAIAKDNARPFARRAPIAGGIL